MFTDDRTEGRPANIGFAKWRAQCFYDSLVQGSSLVFQLNICAINPPLRKAENRQRQTTFFICNGLYEIHIKCNCITRHLLKFWFLWLGYEKQITGKYFITGTDTRDDLHLSYKLRSGDYIGRAPGNVLQYGFNDTFLVAKTKNSQNDFASYYLIDMTKDSEYAQEKDFLIGPLSDEDFESHYSSLLQVKFKNVQP